MKRILILIAAFILDCIFGDPEKLYHPVIAIGKMIDKGEALARKLMPKHEFAAGAIMSVCVVGLSTLFAFAVVKAAYLIHPVCGYIIEALMCWQMLAANSLNKEGMRVYKYVAEGDIDNSRKYVGYIVGRDTAELSFSEIIKAVVETVSENTSDGVIAPMFWFLIGGTPFIYMYKAVNTLDSMIGYRNDRYINFGHFAARMDDVFNFIPASLTGHLLMLASYINGYDHKSAVGTFRTDRYHHLSPNSAKTESVVAGALGIQLGGTHNYFGKPVVKQTIGEKKREPDAEDIRKTLRMMYTASISFLAILLGTGLLYTFLIK